VLFRSPLQVKLSNVINGRGRRPTDQADIDVALALVDEWGRGFVAEVDYELEAKNANDFLNAMEKRGLNAVTCPAVVFDLSTNKVIVTEWIEGTRLDRDASPDVPRLCNVAVNAYLTMLLDTGVLHCDPHPGNLLRTTDGRLCILDWGMTLVVPQDLQYALLEFIAHINTKDYDNMLADFINLGFTPAGKEEQLKKSGITEGLAFAFRQLDKGGGPKKMGERVKEEFKERYGTNLSDEELRKRAREEMIGQMEKQLKSEGVDVNGVTNVMEEMSRRNRELFKLPPYVLYVSRAFSTLEGIGLSINEEYSILQECYPYLARRLFTDNSPRAKSALRTMLLGGSGGTLFSPEKFSELSSGFTSYTAATIDADRDGKGVRAAQDALLDVVLSEEGNAVQDILLEGAARITDAIVREGIQVSRSSSTGKFVESILNIPVLATQRFVPRPLQLFTAPLTLPHRLSQRIFELAEKNKEDKDSLEIAKSLYNFVQKSTGTGSSIEADNNMGTAAAPLNFVSNNSNLRNKSASEIAQEVFADPKIREKLPAVVALSRRFGAALLNRAAERLESSSSDIDTKPLKFVADKLINQKKI